MTTERVWANGTKEKLVGTKTEWAVYKETYLPETAPGQTGDDIVVHVKVKGGFVTAVAARDAALQEATHAASGWFGRTAGYVKTNHMDGALRVTYHAKDDTSIGSAFIVKSVQVEDWQQVTEN